MSQMGRASVAAPWSWIEVVSGQLDNPEASENHATLLLDIAYWSLRVGVA